MKYYKKIIIVILIFIGTISFSACTTNNHTNNYAFEVNQDSTSYTMSRHYGLFTKEPSGIIEIPETYKNLPVTEIDSFACCHEVTTLIGSINLEKINRNAFCCRCWTTNSNIYMHLTEIVFPIDSHLKSIGEQAFFKCETLEKVVLPANFQYFGEGVFMYCSNLKELYIYNTNPPTITLGLSSINSGSSIQTTSFHFDFTVYVPKEAIDLYKSNSSWNSYRIMGIPNDSF